MTISSTGGAQIPGSIGISPGTAGGKIPGPLGFRRVEVTQQGTTRAVKTLEMPPPTAKNSSIIRARVVPWKLVKTSPATTDVLQGELANCPVAAILAALAHTKSGRQRLDDMVTEYTAASVKTTLSKNVITTLTGETANDPDYRPQEKQLTSNRYFSVKLGSDIEVSDVLYVRYSDGSDLDPVYMHSPNSALWPCVIEKAYAVKIGSYEDLDDDLKHPVNEFWPVLVGSKPEWLTIDDKTDLAKIAAVARTADKVPTIAASRENVTRVLDHHGFAVLGIQSSIIELYDPHGKTEKLSLAEFRANFLAMTFGNP